MNITIKPLYLFLAATLALAACTQVDDISGLRTGENEQIVFSASLPTLTARSEVATTDNLKSFYITAFDLTDPDKVVGGTMQTYFANEQVYLNDISKRYTSSNCIWPEPGKESDVLTFFGFYPGLEKMGGATLVNASIAKKPVYRVADFTTAPDIADQVDFITATTSGSMENNFYSGIKLPFTHQLSRVEVKAWSAHKSCNIEIAGVRIGYVNTKGTFNFDADNSGGTWTGLSDKALVEYIFRKGDKIVSLPKRAPATSTPDGAVSIMGNTQPDGNNAMLLPASYGSWDYEGDRNNLKKSMFISVLIRIVDATSSETRGIQQYPYLDKKQGADALEIPRIYLAVDKTTAIVSRRLYKKDNAYYIDAKCTEGNRYTLATGEEVKEFGWAALPVSANWVAGYAYTYTLDYSVGVGLHDPEVTTEHPKAGDPIISDIVGINVSLKEWKPIDVEYPVPGS